MTTSSTSDVRRAGARFHTTLPWLESHHSFSFSRHYDPANTGHGLLLVNNDDIVPASTGFSTHPHQDMEIRPNEAEATAGRPPMDGERSDQEAS